MSTGAITRSENEYSKPRPPMDADDAVLTTGRINKVAATTALKGIDTIDLPREDFVDDW